MDEQLPIQQSTSDMSQTTLPPQPVVPAATTPTTQVTTSQAQPSSFSLHYVGLGKRFVALSLDSIGSFVVSGYLVGLVTGGLTDGGFSLSGLPAMFAFALIFAYFVVFEGTKGATIGKMLMKIKVVKEDGSPCDIQSAIIRNLLRLVDYFFFAIVGIISIMQSDKKQRLGDRLAHTVVVSN